ncbi:hypothetical protein [Gilvibacter sediminis]|uniref:hypothetical protein n=1 Tax=Gilvibacter sediminis TaxID=379071 RepID=UPI002350F5B6|nr:hypothetical protein [Gilvibacter sediminis]MDC7998203.1 hypothetical protein [Gilvibacter sediminis]
MKRLLFIGFFLLSVTSFAQNDAQYVEGLLRDYVEGLQADGVTEIFVRAHKCEGNVQRFMLRDGSWCTSNGTYIDTAVVYAKDEQLYLTKIDNCGLFKAVRLEDPKIFAFYKEHEQTLKTERLKDYDTDVPYTDTKSRTAVYNCRWAYVFFTGTETFNSRYDEIQLTNDMEHPNKNYDYNNNHPLVALEAMVDATLKDLESKGKLNRKY